MFCHCLLYTFSLLILLLLFHNLFCRIALLVKQIDHFHRKKMFCFVQPCLFVQSGHRIFLVKCQGNLCNVGAATGYYQKINWSKIKFAKKWCSDDIGLGFFLCNVVWSLLGNIAQGFYLWICSVVPSVLIHHWTGFFLVHYRLEPQIQYCTRFLPV